MENYSDICRLVTWIFQNDLGRCDNSSVSTGSDVPEAIIHIHIAETVKANDFGREEAKGLFRPERHDSSLGFSKAHAMRDHHPTQEDLEATED